MGRALGDWAANTDTNYSARVHRRPYMGLPVHGRQGWMVVQHAETLIDIHHIPIVLQTEGIIYSASAPKLNLVISTPTARKPT